MKIILSGIMLKWIVYINKMRLKFLGKYFYDKKKIKEKVYLLLLFY